MRQEVLCSHSGKVDGSRALHEKRHAFGMCPAETTKRDKTRPDIISRIFQAWDCAG